MWYLFLKISVIIVYNYTWIINKKGVNMEEYNGRINVPKDTMLFVVNDIFNQDIKENTT